MPVPFLLWAAAGAAALYGGAKTLDAYDNNEQAENIMNEAQYLLEQSNCGLEAQRIATNRSLEKLGKTRIKCWSKDIGSFVEIFEKFKNVRVVGNIGNERINIGPTNLRLLKNSSLKATEMVQSGLGSLAAGTLAGVAAYGGVGMFAAASTGTAISALSGAAATNATLAWLGGGSLAAGGFGVAGGTLALGGVVFAPALAVFGSYYAAEAEENLARAIRDYKYVKREVEKRKIVVGSLRNIENLAMDYNWFIKEFAKRFRKAVNYLYYIYDNHKYETKRDGKVDFLRLSQDEQEALHVICLMAQTLKRLLVQNIINKNNRVCRKAAGLLEQCNREWS